jgi:hypothetical protein
MFAASLQVVLLGALLANADFIILACLTAVGEEIKRSGRQ